MGYKIDVEKLKLSIAFVDRSIRQECGRIAAKEGLKGELEKKQKELQNLTKKREPLEKKREEARLAREMFAFGGEAVAAKDPVEREMKRLEGQINTCCSRIRKLQKESKLTEAEKKFLADVEFLNKEARQIWQRFEINGKNMETYLPKNGCGALESWDRASASPALQVKALLFQTFFCGRTPQWEEEALTVIQAYQSRPEVRDLPVDREKTAFLAAKPQQLLKQVIREAANGNPKELEVKKDKLNESLQGLSLEDSPYPGLALYRQLEAAGWANIQTLQFFGECCHYLSVNQKDELAFVNGWLKWFDEAMGSEACHQAMQGILEAGFADFLKIYGEDSGKCMGKIFGKWKGEPRFSEYAPAFQREIVRYMEEPKYIERAWKATWDCPQKYPLLGSLDPDNRYGTARRQLVTFYTAELAKNWLTMDLSPENWESGRVEGCIKKIIFAQLRLYINGKKTYGSETLGRQLNCYFTEVMARGVWDPELDAGIRDMLDKAVRSGFWSIQSQQVEDNLRVLAKFKGKRRFAPYEMILKKGAAESNGSRLGSMALKPAERSLEENFRDQPWRSKKFWLMFLLSLSLGMNWLVYEIGGLVLAFLLLSRLSHVLYRREIWALELALLAGMAGSYLMGSSFSVVAVEMKGWQESGGAGTFGGFLDYFGLVLFPVGIVTLLALRRVRKEEKEWKKFKPS